jgi:carboxyl-terminal processing protease
VWPPQAIQGYPPAPQQWPPQQWPPQQPPAWGTPQPQPTWGTPPPPTIGSFGPAAGSRNRPGFVRQALVVLGVALVAFSGGMVTNSLLSSPTATATPSAAAQDQPLDGFEVYKQALKIVRDHYVDRSELTDEQLLYGSIRGMVDSLGDTGHTVFLTPEEYQQLQSEMSGKFSGIGVIISDAGGVIVVERVIVGSPADQAGIRAGDQITAVDGQSTSGMTYSEIADLIRGPSGTSVTVTVLHIGSAEPVNISVTRATIDFPILSWTMVPGTHVAHIALMSFSSGATDQLRTAIAEAEQQGATSIVLDLRGNPGGLAAEAVGVASQFLPSGVVYIEEDADGNKTEVTVDGGQTPTSLPLVVLVDHNSASASEIVAGAVQDSHRAKIVGMTTFGTGTILLPYTLSDGSVIFLGVGDWLTPSGHRIFGIGIKPDQPIALQAGVQPLEPANVRIMTEATFEASSDVQLRAAVKDLEP